MRTRLNVREFGFDGGAQGGKGVDGSAFGFEPLLVLGLVDAVHQALEAVRVRRQLVDQQAVNVIGLIRRALLVDGLEEINIIPVWFVDLGLDEQFLARQAFDGTAEHVERHVVGGAIEIGDPVVVGVMDDRGEAFLAQGLQSLAVIGTGAKAQAAEFQAGLAERHLIGGSAFGLPLGPNGVGAQQERARGNAGSLKKLAPVEMVSIHNGYLMLEL
jgi:hypothetical protein